MQLQTLLNCRLAAEYKNKHRLIGQLQNGCQ